MQSNPPFTVIPKTTRKGLEKNVFAWFTRNKLIPKATIKLMQAFEETLERTVRPRSRKIVWPIRVCAAVQGIVLVTSMSKTRCIVLCEYVLII